MSFLTTFLRKERRLRNAESGKLDAVSIVIPLNKKFYTTLTKGDKELDKVPAEELLIRVYPSARGCICRVFLDGIECDSQEYGLALGDSLWVK